MEAFGIAAGVLQVAGFGAEVGSTLWRCAKKLHNASKELESIASQVETTSLSLKRVDELLKDPATRALHTPKLYEDTNTVSQGCHEVFRELDKSVKAYEAKSAPGKMRLLSRTKWLFDSGRLAELGQVLRRYNDVLHLMVSVMTIVEGRRAATKDELQALEANLRVLALSNKDLSDTNKTLAETIAAISRAPTSPLLSPGSPAAPSACSLGIPMIQQGMMFNTLASIPLDSISVQTAPSGPTSEHLQRCMDSVQELAKTIACAMDNWHGRGLLECSDIHGLCAKVSANLEQLPADIECMRCTRRTYKSSLHSSPSRGSLTSTCTCDANPKPAKRRRKSIAVVDIVAPVPFNTKPSDIAIDAAMSSGRSSCDPRYVPQGDIRIQEDGLPPCSADLDLDHSPTLADAQFPAYPKPPVLHDAHAAFDEKDLEQYPDQPTDEVFDHSMAHQSDQMGVRLDNVEWAEPPKKLKNDGRKKAKRILTPPPPAVGAGSPTAPEMPAYNTQEEYEHWFANGNSPAMVVGPVVVDEAPEAKSRAKKRAAMAAWMAGASTGKPVKKRGGTPEQGPQEQQQQQQQQPVNTSHPQTHIQYSSRRADAGLQNHDEMEAWKSEIARIKSLQFELKRQEDEKQAMQDRQQQQQQQEQRQQQPATMHTRISHAQIEDLYLGRVGLSHPQTQSQASSGDADLRHHDEAEAHQANERGNSKPATLTAESVRRAPTTFHRDRRPARPVPGSHSKSTISSARTGTGSIRTTHDGTTFSRIGIPTNTTLQIRQTTPRPDHVTSAVGQEEMGCDDECRLDFEEEKMLLEQRMRSRSRRRSDISSHEIDHGRDEDDPDQDMDTGSENRGRLRALELEQRALEREDQDRPARCVRDRSKDYQQVEYRHPRNRTRSLRRSGTSSRNASSQAISHKRSDSPSRGPKPHRRGTDFHDRQDNRDTEIATSTDGKKHRYKRQRDGKRANSDAFSHQHADCTPSSKDSGLDRRSRSSSPARGRNRLPSSRNGRGSSNASDQRDYILDLADPEQTPEMRLERRMKSRSRGHTDTSSRSNERRRTFQAKGDFWWSIDRVQSWMAMHKFSDAWQAAFEHLDVQGSRFLDLGRASGVQRNVSFMVRTILPQVNREHERCALVTDSTSTSLRDEGRRLRGLVRDLLAYIAVGDWDLPDYPGSETYHNSRMARSPRARNGDFPAVEVPQGSSSLSSRDRLPVDIMPVDSRMSVDRMPVDRISVSRMPADRMTIDRKQDDHMQLDTPSGPPQGREYQKDRNGYPPDLRYGADADASEYRDVRTPPGFVRQGNYYVPISSVEQPRTDYGSSHPYSQPTQPQRMDTREMRDAHYVPIPRNGKSTRKEENEQRDQPDRQKSSRNPRLSIDFPERMYIPPPPPPMNNPQSPYATYVRSFGPGIGIPPSLTGNDSSQSSSPEHQVSAKIMKRRPMRDLDSMDGHNSSVESESRSPSPPPRECENRAVLVQKNTTSDFRFGCDMSADRSDDDISADRSDDDMAAVRDHVGNDEDAGDVGHCDDDNDDDVDVAGDDYAAGQASAVQALLHRWLDSSASALLLKDDEPVT